MGLNQITLKKKSKCVNMVVWCSVGATRDLEPRLFI